MTPAAQIKDLRNKRASALRSLTQWERARDKAEPNVVESAAARRQYDDALMHVAEFKGRIDALERRIEALEREMAT